MAQNISPREAKRTLETLYQYQEADLYAAASATSERAAKLIYLMIRGRHATIVAIKLWLARNVK